MSRTALRVALAGSVVLLALAGCRTAPPKPTVTGPGADASWNEHLAALRNLDGYSLSGRIAVAANGQGFSGSLRYRQQAQRAEMSIDGPMGIGGLRIVLDGENVSITNSRGETLNGNAARAELEQRLGFELPLQNLRWWLLGIPVPVPKDGQTVEVVIDQPPPPQFVSLKQEGWNVGVTRVLTQGFSVPQRITIERDGARLKLIVEKWQP